MGRVIAPIVVLLLLAAVTWGVIALVRSARARNKRRRMEQTQRDLATFAPAVLDGSPLVDVVIAQGQRLGEVADLLKALMANEIHVFMPNSDRQRISDWITEYEKNRKAQS